MGRSKADFREARERMGLTYSSLSKKIGYSAIMIAKWEDPTTAWNPPKEAWDQLDHLLAEHLKAVDHLVDQATSEKPIAYWHGWGVTPDGVDKKEANARAREAGIILTKKGLKPSYMYET